MDWLHFLLIGLLAAAIITINAYRRQIKTFCRQLSFLKKHDSNMRLTQQMDDKYITELAAQINDLIKRQRSMEKEYQKKEAELKSTITSLSHDIRTPLTSLDGYFQLLKDSNDEAEKDRYREIIQERLVSLKDILEELFLFTKIQNEDYKMELEKIPLQTVLFEVIFSFYEEFEKRNIIPNIMVSEEPVWINANAQGLRRIFQNILKNSLLHGTDEIGVSLLKEETTISLIFTNPIKKGDTLDPQKVFQRFYKADPARSHHSTGLGLAIAKELTDKMNARIEASVLEEKFCVTVTFKEYERN